MKRFKIITWLSLLLVALFSVACSDDEIVEKADHRLVGTWELDGQQWYVNASDEYFECILEQVLVGDGLLADIFFSDTIQFDKNGYFLETGNLVYKEILESGYGLYPEYKTVEDVLFVQPSIYMSTVGNKRAVYELPDDEMLVLTIEYIDEYDRLKMYLRESGEFGKERIDNLIITSIKCIQFYKKIEYFPGE